MTQIRRLKGVNRIGGVIGRYGPNGDSGVWPVHSRASDPYYDQVQLLLHMDGTDGSTTFTDSSKNRSTVTANGNAQVDNGQTKFGESLLLDGTGGYLEIPHNAALNIGSKDFCIEAWVYPTITSSFRTILNKGFPVSGGQGEFTLNIEAGNIVFRISQNGSTGLAYGGGGAVSLNTWTHVAFVRQGSVYRAYRNGAQTVLGTAAVDLFAGTSSLRVGRNNNNANGFVGNIDDLRLTIGSPRYLAGGFTPPARAFLP